MQLVKRRKVIDDYLYLFVDFALYVKEQLSQIRLRL